MHLDHRALHAQQDESDQRHSRDAVSLKSIGGGTNRISGIVAGAVGNHARIARVVFFDLEDNFHQVGTDVGDLGENSAGNT